MTAIARTGETIAMTPDTLAEALQHPFWVLPVELRQPAFAYWVVMQYAFKSPLDMTGPIAMDLSRGLTARDAAGIIDLMSEPDERQKIKASWDFGPEWTRHVANALRRREVERKAAELRGPEISPEERARTAEILKGVVTSFATDGVKS